MEKVVTAPIQIKPKGGLMKELFGQLTTISFWRDLVVFALKTAIHVGVEMATVAAGYAVVEFGRKFGRGSDEAVARVKERFQGQQVPGPAPAAPAAAFSRGFNPGPSEYRNTYPAQGQGGEPWPGLANNGFGR